MRRGLNVGRGALTSGSLLGRFPSHLPCVPLRPYTLQSHRSILSSITSAGLRRNWHSSTISYAQPSASVDDAVEQREETEAHEERARQAKVDAKRAARNRRASALAEENKRSEDPEEAQQQQEEEEVRRLQQLRLERAELANEDDTLEDAESEPEAGRRPARKPSARNGKRGESERDRKTCLAYCTADSYVLPKLYRALRADEVISSEWKISYIRRDRKYIRLRCFDDSEIYIFPFGSFVCWDVDDADFVHVRQLIRACERGERTELYEDFAFSYGNDTAVDPEDDELILKRDDATAKWPVSFALAQSIKLDYFEKEVKDTFEEMRGLSHYLARSGSIPLGPKQIVQEMGQIMELLVNVNLGETDFVSDIPDDFWEDAESATTWKIFNSHLGVKNRAKVLDSQLKMFNDFYSMLSSEVHVKKSTRLEWAIIFLISIEVVFGVADHADWLASFIP